MDNEPKHKLWVRVVEAHAARVWLAIILGVFAGLSLLVISVGSVWNNLANPAVNDLAGNYNTLLASVLSLIFGGLVGFLGGSAQQTYEAKPGEVPVDEDLVLDIDPPDEAP